MKRLMFAMAAMVPLLSVGCGHCGHWLDATFCQPCNKGHMVGGCWGGECGYGEPGCKGCVRGQNEEMIKGEVVYEGDMAYGGEAFGDDCDCENCRGRRHGGMRHGGMGPGGGMFGGNGIGGRRAPVAGGPPTAQVAYPYYTTRAPRDFLNPNPRGIGR